MDKIYGCFIIKRGVWSRVVIVESSAEKAESKLRDVLSYTRAPFTIIGVEEVTVANGRAKRPLFFT